MKELEANHLFLRDMPESAELALVFGHSNEDVASRRARHAARLYREGFARRLLLSGGPTTARLSEAAFMAGVALKEGVPREDIFLEEASTDTFENAERSLHLLREKHLLEEVTTILLVSCPWHMKRVFLVAKQTFPTRIRLLACPHEESWRPARRSSEA